MSSLWGAVNFELNMNSYPAATIPSRWHFQIHDWLCRTPPRFRALHAKSWAEPVFLTQLATAASKITETQRFTYRVLHVVCLWVEREWCYTDTVWRINFQPCSWQDAIVAKEGLVPDPRTEKMGSHTILVTIASEVGVCAPQITPFWKLCLNHSNLCHGCFLHRSHNPRMPDF